MLVKMGTFTNIELVNNRFPEIIPPIRVQRHQAYQNAVIRYIIQQQNNGGTNVTPPPIVLTDDLPTITPTLLRSDATSTISIESQQRIQITV